MSAHPLSRAEVYPKDFTDVSTATESTAGLEDICFLGENADRDQLVAIKTNLQTFSGVPSGTRKVGSERVC